MSVSMALLALVAAQTFSIPLQKPPPTVERPIAPVETAGPAFDAACEGSEDWDKPAPPVGVYGNTYYVGTCGISAILITSPQGHILIDSGTEAGAELVAENIRALGFRLTDVKFLLHSHEHHDHVGGMARLQQLTGAQIVASPAAAAVLKTGAAGQGDPQAGTLKAFPAANVGRIIRDGEIVRLGDNVMTAVATPGHTPGALSWRWGSCKRGVCRQVVYADSLSPVSSETYRFSDRPAYVQSYRASIEKVRRLACDILLTPHPSASKMPERFALRAPIENPEACRDYAASLTARLDERLAKEAAAR